jgi:hypothetical protein
MIDNIKARVARINQEIQHLVQCCNSEKGTVEEEFDEVRRNCQIIAQQVETTRVLSTQVLEGHNQQI